MTDKYEHILPGAEDGLYYHEHTAELMHYTNGVGLFGMLNSNSVWCTHYEFLNDIAEFSVGVDLYRSWVRPLLNKIGCDLETRSVDFRSAIETICKSEGMAKQALFETEGLAVVDAVINTYKKMSPSYICSFCKPADGRERNNGLLSMWRGYGATGGYGLVFDCEGLTNLMECELTRYSHSALQIGDVCYSETPELECKLETRGPHINAYIPDQWCKTLEIECPVPADMQEFFRSVSLTFPMIKDAGFKEEREARLVCSPLAVPKNIDDERIDRPVQFTDRQGTPTPHVALFEGLDTKLPIVEILVGPSQHSRRRVKGLEMLLASAGYENVTVNVSEIPFVEP